MFNFMWFFKLLLSSSNASKKDYFKDLFQSVSSSSMVLTSLKSFVFFSSRKRS